MVPCRGGFRPKMVTHLSTNWAYCRVTALIESNVIRHQNVPWNCNVAYLDGGLINSMMVESSLSSICFRVGRGSDPSMGQVGSGRVGLGRVG